MPYTHLLVAVAPTPESQVLIKKAVSIARPVNAKVSLITLATDPELYNQFDGKSARSDAGRDAGVSQ